jgi:hypothetical protein
MLVPFIVIDVVAGAVFVLAWYCFFSRYNRRKSCEILRWIERASRGHGEITDVLWAGRSRFHVHLNLTPSIFRRASLTVQPYPREQPLLWLAWRFRKQQETLTFSADLDCAPCFNLEVQNHRWLGRTRRHFPLDSQHGGIEHAGPFVLTTRNDWQRDITAMMGALVASRQCDCLTVSIRRCSPHFSVTVPLATISPGSDTKSEIFDVLRELAAGATSARF